MASTSLAHAPARPWPRSTVRARPWTTAAFCLVALVLLLSGGTPPRPLRVEQTAAPLAFPLVDWHLARLAERSQRIVLGLLGARPAPSDADRAAVRAYFAASPPERAALAPAAEAGIERAATSVLRDEALGTAAPWASDGALIFPPVSFTFTAPPRVLVVSRRDRIGVVQSELLRTDISTAEAERLEAAVDSLGYSSLVVPIGGLATYPTMVLEGTRPLDTVTAVAHEWVHGYLFFTPLGLRYWSSQEARTINETAAELVSRELGPRIAHELGLDVAPTGRPEAPRPATLQFRTMMRETRVELDQLLAAGRVEEAEVYLRARRLDFLAAGYEIRKLNQAYFAFYGSYGEGAAGRSPIPGQLERLRAASGSPGAFLERVGRITSAAELARAVGEAPTAAWAGD